MHIHLVFNANCQPSFQFKSVTHTHPFYLRHTFTHFSQIILFRPLYQIRYITFCFLISASTNAMTDIATDGVAHVMNKLIVDPLIKRIDDALHLDRNRGVLQDQLTRMQLLLQDISNGFENQQKKLPELILDDLNKTSDAIGEASSLIVRSRLQQQGLGFIFWPWDCLFCKPGISTQIRKCKEKIDKLYHQLQDDLKTFVTSQQALRCSPGQDLLQPVPDKLFKGSGTRSAETELQKLLKEDPHVREISVYGMPGVGKTTLLKMVYNSHKVSKASFFTDVIWVTVSQRCEIPDLQDQIAQEINLDLSSITNIDTRKMKLCASLKKKKFLLILDDLWSALNLQEVGVAFEEGSKVVFSTRVRNLTLGKEQKTIKVETLSAVEGREMFNILAFQGGDVPDKLVDCARKTADECKGLPLAITVVAAAMKGKTEVEEWNLFFSLMKTADPCFRNTHPTVDKDLYQKLRTSYEYLPKGVQHCFLYCAMYPEDKKIDVDALVRVWIAEGLVKSRRATDSKYNMDLGRSYVKLLIDRCLFEDVSFERRSKNNVQKPVNVWKGMYITVHDVIREMAIYVGEEVNFLCSAGQQLKDFPDSAETQDCKRISLFRNQIKKLPDDFKCPKLVSLILSENPSISYVPESFLFSLHSLRVLDLSHTQIESVPTSVSQLQLLEFLTLSSTNIKELPLEICSLSRLTFLDLSDCRFLTSLPPEMSKLTSLKRLHLSIGMEKALNDPKNVMALKGLTNLIELRLFMFLKFDAYEMMASITGTWLEMRHLHLHHMNSVNSNPVRCNLPEEMQNMKKLESLVLVDYIGVNLSDWMCGFQQLERLELDGSDNVKELPPLERLPNLKFLKLRKYSKLRDLKIGSSGNSEGFPMLEILHLSNLPRLISISLGEDGMLKERTLLKLQVLKITKSRGLRNLPRRMGNLPKLRAIYGHQGWWDDLRWENEDMKKHLFNLFKEI